ncbi:MAG: hypothetical protein ACFFDN_03845 [Candidatus Hodarchaeota archaeon]
MRSTIQTESHDPLLTIAAFGFLIISSCIEFFSINLFVGATSNYYLYGRANASPMTFIPGIIMSAGIILTGIKFVVYFKEDKKPITLIIFIGSLVVGVFNTLMYSLFWFMLRNTPFYIMFGVSFYCLATYLILYSFYFKSVSNSTQKPKYTLIVSNIVIFVSLFFLIFSIIYVGTTIIWFEGNIAQKIFSIPYIIFEPPFRDFQRIFSISYLSCGISLFMFPRILFLEAGWKESTDSWRHRRVFSWQR